jgi:DNA-binding CsgD family transcriptional regulator
VPGRAILGEALVPPHELVRTAFYAEYLRPMGCYHRLAGTVVRVGHRILYLTLHRPPLAPSFEPAEHRALAWLLPRLARPVLLHRELLQRCTGSAAFRALLDQVPHALFLVDGELRPVAMNGAAAAMTEAGSPLRVAAGRLVAARGEDDEALHRAVRAALGGVKGRPRPAELALRRDCDLQSVLLRVARLGAHGGFADAPEELVLILAIDPEARRGQPAAAAARLWGLTPAEARLCHLLARGLRPAEAARELGLSPHTVHAQLRQIFAKAGVHRQAELLRLLERLSVPPS